MKLVIYAGNFGSGKTEISLNYAMREARHGQPVTLVDLDVVKPYFRSREAEFRLQRAGIRLISPQSPWSKADLPVVTPEITGALTKGDGLCIIDLGGDNLGATALGQFKPHLDRLGGSLWMVVNPFRPATADITGFRNIMQEIEQGARLKTSWLISNPNLGPETTVADILEGHSLVQRFAGELELPIRFLAVSKPLCDSVKDLLPDMEILPVEKFMLPPWQFDSET